MKREKNPGEKNKYDVIRHILKIMRAEKIQSQEKKSKILQRKWDDHIGRNALEKLYE